MALPTFTSAAAASGVVGSAFSYTITGAGTPTAFAAYPLPPGLALNSATGVISGTPTIAGQTFVNVYLSNTTGETGGPNAAAGSSQGSGILVITITNAPPTLTSLSPASGYQGTSFPLIINGANLFQPVTVNISGAGVTISNIFYSSQSQITVTLTIAPAAATGVRTISVTDSVGTSNTLNFTISAPPPPGINITISPLTVTLSGATPPQPPYNTKTQQYTITVTGGVLNTFTATIGSQDGSGPGTLSGTYLYTAPDTFWTRVITLTVTSIDNPAVFAIAKIRVLPFYNWTPNYQCVVCNRVFTLDNNTVYLNFDKQTGAYLSQSNLPSPSPTEDTLPAHASCGAFEGSAYAKFNKNTLSVVFGPIGYATSLAVTPSAIIPFVGTSHFSKINTAFVTFLVALVTDNTGNPVQYSSVTFTAPANGAGGSFPGGATSVVITTDINGLATAPLFTANQIVGTYLVIASLLNGLSAQFQLSNTPT